MTTVTGWKTVDRLMMVRLRKDISEANRQIIAAQLGRGPWKVIAVRQYEMNAILERHRMKKRYMLKLCSDWGDEVPLWYHFFEFSEYREKIDWIKDGF